MLVTTNFTHRASGDALGSLAVSEYSLTCLVTGSLRSALRLAVSEHSPTLEGFEVRSWNVSKHSLRNRQSALRRLLVSTH